MMYRGKNSLTFTHKMINHCLIINNTKKNMSIVVCRFVKAMAVRSSSKKKNKLSVRNYKVGTV